MSDKIKQNQIGTANPGLQIDIIQTLMINLPTNLAEQTKIARFLSLLDQQITLTEALLQDYQLQKTYYLNQLMTQKLRFKNFTEERREARLGELVEIKKGEQLNKSHFISNGKYYVMNGGIKPSGLYNLYNTEPYNITISNGGSCGFVKYHDKPFWCGGDAFILNNLSNKINYQFMYYILKYNQNNLQKLQTGTSIKHIAKEHLKNFTLSFIFDLAEQTKIARFLSLLDQQITLTEALSKDYQLQKQYYLNQLLH